MKNLISKTTISRKKKRGFTLVELIAVMAIIAILSSVLAPKVIGYIEEGKKTSATEEARQVVLAIESYNVKADSSDDIASTDAYSVFSTKLTGKNYIDTTELNAIGDTNTYAQLKAIVKGTKSFSLTNDKIVVTP